MQANIYSISPFDATTGGTIRFSYTGNQVFKNRCIIKTNDTNETVYDNTIDSFKLEHEIDLSKATLINGNRYIAFITVFDVNNVESDIQPTGTPFLCLSTPTFQFENIKEESIIPSSSYTFNLSYAQSENELLNSWSISIYSVTHTLLSTSDVKYDTDNLSYTFSGFTDKNEYYVRAIGQTINGIELDTGYVNVSVSYAMRDVFFLLETENLPDVGAIKISSNIVTSEGFLTKDGEYIDGEFLDLRDNTVTYNDGFTYHDDFSHVIKFYGMKPNQEIMKLYNKETGKLSGIITYRVTKVAEIGENGNEIIVEKSYFELKIISNLIASVYYSNQLPLLSETDLVGICVRRKNNAWDIFLHKYE